MELSASSWATGNNLSWLDGHFASLDSLPEAVGTWNPIGAPNVRQWGEILLGAKPAGALL